jgi:thymidylate kinase
LPDNLSSDLDLAMHPDDISKLPGVLLNLRRNGYRPLHAVNYALKECRFDFIWFELEEADFVAVDIIHGYVEGGLFLIPGPVLVVERQKRNGFWVAGPATEFRYLLARTTLKGRLPERHAQRLKSLVEELGRGLAEELAGRLFGKQYKVKATEACVNGSLRELLPELKIQLWGTVLRRDPLNPIRHMLANGVRIIQRWLEPSGIMIVFLGPDGVGKSTLISHLAQLMGTVFRGHCLFHYRPGLLGRRKYTGDVTDPHGRSEHSVWWSLGRLLLHIMDYWANYWLIVRPKLTRSGLVVFDRYFYDLVVDPKRYRYGGPLWAVRILRALIPKPNLVFVLDAPAQVLLSRKQEVASEEVQRQRETYLKEAKTLPRARVIDTSACVAEVAIDVAKAIVEYSDHRLQRRCARWMAFRKPVEQAQDLGERPSV